MAVTSNVTVTLCVADGAVAVTAIVYVPSGVAASVASMSITLPPAVMLLGANPGVAPAGSPVAEKARVSGVPAVDVVDSVVAPALPWTTLRVVGAAASAKSDVAVTSNDTVVVCVADGAVPVIVTVYVPGGVAASAASVSIDDPPVVALVGANVAVAPTGRSVAENVIVSAVPAIDMVDTVVIPELPWTTLTIAGSATIAKSGRASTSSDTVVVCVADGAVPVIVTVYVPGAVVASAASISVDDAPAVTLVGTNVAVAPAGRPLADSAMVSGVPAVDTVATVVIPELPWTTLTIAGDALIEKSGFASTVNDTVAVCVADGAVPVIVTV